MSKYKRIVTQFKTPESLRLALMDLGRPYEIHQKPQHLMGYRGDTRPETAHVIIRRQHVGSKANDFGLLRNADGVYEAIISEYDQSRGGARILQTLKQRYAVHESIRLAKTRGLTLVEETAANGVVRLKLRGYR